MFNINIKIILTKQNGGISYECKTGIGRVGEAVSRGIS